MKNKKAQLQIGLRFIIMIIIVLIAMVGLAMMAGSQFGFFKALTMDYGSEGEELIIATSISNGVGGRGGSGFSGAIEDLAIGVASKVLEGKIVSIYIISDPSKSGSDTPQAAELQEPTTQVVVGDFKGNGLTRVAVISDSGDRVFSVYPNSYLIADFTWKILGMVSGDFDGDGSDEIAVVTDNGYSVYIIADPSVEGSNKYETADFSPSVLGIVTGDFDGDEDDEIAVVTGNGYDIAVITDPSGTSSDTHYAYESTDNIVGGMVVGDFDGDGNDEIAIADVSYTIGDRYYIDEILVISDPSVENSDFHSAYTFDDYIAGIEVGDFDGDGNDEIAVTEIAATIGDVNYIEEVLVVSDPSVTDSSTHVAHTFDDYISGFMESGDFDGDGNDEIAVISLDGREIFVIPDPSVRDSDVYQAATLSEETVGLMFAGNVA